jgi:thiamine biosynthesis lipoprotein ApbE
MLSKMLEIARKTDGYFDPTIGKRLTELGYGKMELQIDKSLPS